MLKIGEFSQLGQVTIRTLRHYDELRLLQPAYVDPENEYRYYTIEQLPRLNRIVALKDLGLSLEQIRRILESEPTVATLQGLLKEREMELAREITEQQATLARVRARLRMIEQERQGTQFEVTQKSVPSVVLASIRQVAPTLAEMADCRCVTYRELYRRLGEYGIMPSGPEIVLYHQREYVERFIDMDLGVIVPASALDQEPHGVTITQLPALPTVARVVYQGDIWDIPQALVALYRWVNANRLTADGPYREIHLSGREMDHVDFSSVTLEFQLPISDITR